MYIRFLKYSLGGLTAFAIDLLFINIFLSLGVNDNVSIILGFVLATLAFSFFFHQRITFKAKNAGESGRQFSKYSIVSVIVFIVDVGLAIVFKNILLSHFSGVFATKTLVLAGKTMGAAVAGIAHFIFLKEWVFVKNEKPAESTDEKKTGQGN